VTHSFNFGAVLLPSYTLEALPSGLLTPSDWNLLSSELQDFFEDGFCASLMILPTVTLLFKTTWFVHGLQSGPRSLQLIQ
jgi:hypothetical protein